MQMIPDDRTLVQQARAGDKQAFSQLVVRHWARVQRILRAVLPPAADGSANVDDLAQEAFLQAYLSLDTLREPTRFCAWVCGIGINLGRMWRRQRPFTLTSWEALPLPDPQPTPEQRAARSLTLDRLAQAIADLPPSEREALLLVYRDGLSHRETADRLGASLSAVKVRVHRGRRRLQTHFQEEQAVAGNGRIAREDTMITVEIMDVLAAVIDEREFGIDKEALFAEALAQVDPALHANFLSGASLSVTLGVHFWEKMIMPLSDDVRRPVMQALGKFLPHRVVLLREHAGARILPIWIGPFEADSIALKLANRQLTRPVSSDLTKTLLDLSGTRLEKATVSKLHDGIFYGSLLVQLPGQEERADVDCRPSDALTLAVRTETPVFVAAAVMDAEAVPADLFARQEDGRYAIQHKSMQDRVWQSMLA